MNINALTLADIAALDGDRVACPECGPGHAATHKRNKKVLRIWRVEPGFATYCCARCGFKGYTHDGTNRSRRSSPSELMVARAQQAERKQKEASDGLSRIEAARRILDAAEPGGETVDRYLTGRAIRLPALGVIQFGPVVWHPYERRGMPAMVSTIEHPITGSFMGVHITFLRPFGSAKAEVTPTRIMRGLAGGGIVRLAEPAEVLAVAEGIESGFSFMQLSGIPTWPALSAGNFCRLKLPATAREVVIAADNDERGLADARKAGCRWRMEGRRVRIVHPRVAGQDWNDVLKGGANG